MNDTPNISIGTVTGGQNNIGKIEIAGNQVQQQERQSTVDLNDQELTLAVMSAVRSTLPPNIPEVDPGEWKELESAASESHAPTVQQASALETFFAKIKPHGKLIWKSLACFGQGALESLAKTNPVINGILDVCRMHMEDDDVASQPSPKDT